MAPRGNNSIKQKKDLRVVLLPNYDVIESKYL